jgi:hypothetical protein
MIMTKEKVRELNAMTGGRLAGVETLPADGAYVLSATQDAEIIRKASENATVDYFIMGTVIPSHKAAAVCQLLQDENGMMPSPIVMLKKHPGLASTALSQTSHVSSGRVPAIRPMHEEAAIRIKNIEIIPGRHEVKVAGKPVTLTFSEFRILQTLAGKPGWVFSRDQIIQSVHGDHYNCTERAVDVQVTGLRKKLGAAGRSVETVRGVGYRFRE